MRDALLAAQNADGHWVYELEADSTIPAEYVLLVHYLGETPNLELEQKIGKYLRRIQQADGGWPLFTDGAPNISASVKAYFALKVIGDDENAERTCNVRAAPSTRWAAPDRVFTRIQLALAARFRGAVPMMPVEIMLLPQWFPFHLSKVSYWARTVIVPLLVLNAKRPLAKEPARRAHRRTVHRSARQRRAAAAPGPPELVRVLPRGRSCVARGRRVVPELHARTRDPPRPCRSSTSA